ncbi:MAG TPA: phage tail protein [Terracidiphilus sp.]|jgi:phage tail-like protein
MSSATPQASTFRNDPFTAGNFRVEIQGITATSFSEVRGLELSIDVVEYRPGDAKGNTEQKLPGMYKSADVTLKRGLTRDLSLWNWINSGLNGNITRTSVAIVLLDQADNPVLVWKLRNAWPRKWSGPALNAGCSDVAIEELELAHEGLELSAP